VFVGVFFGGSLIIETIFSLDGLGRLAFEAAVARDYPVIFGTLFVFGLIGLVVNIISDLMYVWIDPRIDFRNAGDLRRWRCVTTARRQPGPGSTPSRSCAPRRRS
jgi:microcin C transport system permease protein